jgi:hypothetical protein
MKMRWLEGKLESGTPLERQKAVEKLLTMGEDGEAVVDKNLLGRSKKWVKERFGSRERVTRDLDREFAERMRKKSKQMDVRLAGNYKSWWYNKIVIDFEDKKVEKVWLRTEKPPQRGKW